MSTRTSLLANRLSSVALLLVLSTSVAACTGESETSVFQKPEVAPVPEPETAPVPQPETVPVPELAPEPSGIDEAEQRAVWADVVEAQRGEWVAALENTWDVESIDRLEFEGDALVVGVTSGWASPDRRQEAVWSIARELRVLWTDDTWPSDILRDPVWFKDLLLTVDQFRYICSGETMRQLAERRLERSQWEAACR